MSEGIVALDLLTAGIGLLLSFFVLIMLLYLRSSKRSKISDTVSNPLALSLGFLTLSQIFNFIHHATSVPPENINIFEHASFIVAIFCMSFVVSRVYKLYKK
jgi:amino acid permease